MTDFYTPQQNGIGGLEDFGGEFFNEEMKNERPVYLGGVKLVGPTYEPALVAEFFHLNPSIAPTVRLQKVLVSPTAPPTIATRADLRRGWRYEAVVGLPDSMRGPVAVAEGALAFVPGWDQTLSSAIAQTAVYVDDEGIYHAGVEGSGASLRTLDYENDGE